MSSNSGSESADARQPSVFETVYNEVRRTEHARTEIHPSQRTLNHPTGASVNRHPLKPEVNRTYSSPPSPSVHFSAIKIHPLETVSSPPARGLKSCLLLLLCVSASCEPVPEPWPEQVSPPTKTLGAVPRHCSPRPSVNFRVCPEGRRCSRVSARGVDEWRFHGWVCVCQSGCARPRRLCSRSGARTHARRGLSFALPFPSTRRRRRGLARSSLKGLFSRDTGV
jgi:hypothetical protein